MGKSRVIAAIAGVATTAALLGASTASAATLVGDYQLQGTRGSSGPGPALTDIAGGNAFQTDNVMRTSRQVLTFPRHSGVQMLPSVGNGSVPYSVVSTFRLDQVTTNPDSNYDRILDSSNATSDLGFYSHSGNADYYGDTAGEVLSGSVVFSDSTYVTVAITSLPPTLSRIYVNGALVVSAPETLPVVNDTLRLFKDNNDYEESGGAVSCVRVYTGALTDDEVAAIGASPTCQAPPAPVIKKKCKKHKKKHRAADAKKKKCKKKKKR